MAAPVRPSDQTHPGVATGRVEIVDQMEIFGDYVEGRLKLLGGPTNYQRIRHPSIPGPILPVS